MNKQLALKLHVLDNACSKAVQAYKKQNKILAYSWWNRTTIASMPRKQQSRQRSTIYLQRLPRSIPSVQLSCGINSSPQVEFTLNLLRTSRRDTTKSAYCELEGEYDFNHTSMSVIGAKALAYVDPAVRAAWEPHAMDAFYVSMCPQHYRLLEFLSTKPEVAGQVGRTKFTPPNASSQPFPRRIKQSLQQQN